MTPTPEIAFDPARARAAQIACANYGRLIGILSAPSGDIASAEDALSDALQAALTRWPEAGLPDNPEAWLVRVARNRMTEAHRRALRQHPVAIEDHALALPADAQPQQPDPRLALLFVCAHPGIAEAARSPLMLQTVLGFTAAQIARAYVSSPAAMSKLLVRAKARIKANAIPFRVPEDALRSERLPDVTEAIYGCYSLVWRDGPEAEDIQREALYLADLLASLIPDDPEVLGLSALMGFLHARRDARLRDGLYVPLHQQQTELWDHGLIAAAETRLRGAFRHAGPDGQAIGRFQIEAAIQAVHAARARTGKTDWEALLPLHEGLARIAPTLGASVGRAAVIGEVHGLAAGLAALDMPCDPRLDRFQPYWATRAHLLAQAGEIEAAQAAYARAISLTLSPPVRAFLAAARVALAQP